MKRTTGLSRLLLSSACALVIGISGASAAPKAVTLARVMQEKGYVVVPLKRQRNHAVARCYLNGSPMDFVVDTGASGTTVERNLAYKAGTVTLTKEKEASYGALGKLSKSVYNSEIASFKVGDFDGGKTPVGFLDMATPSQARSTGAQTGNQSIDGLLGIDFLYRHRAVIDCFQLNLFLAAGAARAASGALASGLRAGGYTEIPLRVSGGSVVVPVTIKGKSGYLVLDTGAPNTLLTNRIVQAAGLKRAGGAGGMRDVGGSVTGLLQTQVEDMKIGGFAVPNQWVAATNPGFGRDDVRMGGSDVNFGYLGQDILAYYVGIIDCGALKLYLRLDPVVEAERKRRGQ